MTPDWNGYNPTDMCSIDVDSKLIDALKVASNPESGPSGHYDDDSFLLFEDCIILHLWSNVHTGFASVGYIEEDMMSEALD